MADRPAVETLVHNLEHGYTVVWYRDTHAGGSDQAAAADLQDVHRRADYDQADKFIAAPWTDADGAGFPEGKNVVLTRWYADPNESQRTSSLRRAPGSPVPSVSGEAIQDFMAKYPSTSAPEPNGA